MNLSFYSQEKYLVFCADVCSVLEVLGREHDNTEWRLFIDSSKVSLKAVLLHNGIKFPSVPLAHAANTTESYENMKLILEEIQYDKSTWNICGDLKVIALVLGYTKFCCFRCEWNSRDRRGHYTRKDWPKRDSLTPGNKSVRHPPLFKPENVYLHPLHIKLRLMKSFVKGLSDAKIKEGIFVGPQIRELMHDTKFEEQLTLIEKVEWSFKNVP
jgi:hypothetical protein